MTKVKDRMGFEFRFVHTNKNGEVLYDSGFQPNQMADEGFEQMFDVYFREGAAPEKFQIGLATVNPAQTTTLLTVAEVSNTGDGYERQDVLRDNSADGFPTLALDDDNMQIESKMVEFENVGSGAWDTATDGFLTAVMDEDYPDDNNDKFVCWKALTVGRILQIGDKLNVQIKQKGKQPPSP